MRSRGKAGKAAEEMIGTRLPCHLTDASELPGPLE
jgi:hypothetical protein